MPRPYRLRSSGFVANIAIVGETFFGGRTRSVVRIAWDHDEVAGSRGFYFVAYEESHRRACSM
jgi:hypothetical protein